MENLFLTLYKKHILEIIGLIKDMKDNLLKYLHITNTAEKMYFICFL